MKTLPQDCKDELVEAIKYTRSLQFGDFTLKSGAKSNFYLDLRILTLTSIGAAIVSKNLERILADVMYDAIGGPSIGADPIVGAFLLREHCGPDRNPDGSIFAWEHTRGFLIRSQEKDHGKAGLVVGSVDKDDTVVVVEDVTTSGGSLMRAVDEIEKFGCKVAAAVTIVDRLQGAVELFAGRGIPFQPMLTIKDLPITGEGT